MDMSTVMWVIVAAIVALIVIVAVVALMKRRSAVRDEHARHRAEELREQAAATQEGIRRRQAEADAADATAREKRAEADRKLAEAKRMEMEASEKKSTLHEHVQRRDEVLREADELDPDVRPNAGSEVAPDARADSADTQRTTPDGTDGTSAPRSAGQHRG